MSGVHTMRFSRLAELAAVSLAGEKGATNTFDDPDVIKPVQENIAVAAEFTHTIPAMAVQCIRISME